MFSTETNSCDVRDTFFGAAVPRTTRLRRPQSYLALTGAITRVQKVRAQQFHLCPDAPNLASIVDAAQRSRFLDENCASNSELRREVEALLKRDDKRGFLNAVGGVMGEITAG